MKLSDLSQEKRNSLIKIGLGSVIALAVVWFFLISPAQAKYSARKNESTSLEGTLKEKKALVQRADQIKAKLEENQQDLAIIEDQMVSGDPYRWIIRTFREFERPGQIEFLSYEAPVLTDAYLPNGLNNKEITFVIKGTAAYHDFGSFLERFENSYPHIRIHRIELDPVSGGFVADEKLSFLLEIIVLVRPTANIAR